MPLSDLKRYSFLPAERKPKIAWPNGARVAFWVVPNIEFYELNPGGTGGGWPRPVPDILNYSLRDYGNRTGVWRAIDVMDAYGMRGSVSLNAAVCDHFPELIAACVERGWELFSHGIYNTQLIYGLADADVLAMIRESVDTIAAASGAPVRGFLGPALSATDTFFDLLPRCGIQYTIDVVHDDRPTPINVRDGRLISLPYSAEINDIRVLGVRGYSAGDYVAMVKAAFDQLYEEGDESGTVLCLPIHPFVIGQPHRIAALADVLKYITSHDGVWLATGNEIADWYNRNNYDAEVSAIARYDGSR